MNDRLIDVVSFYNKLLYEYEMRFGNDYYLEDLKKRKPSVFAICKLRLDYWENSVENALLHNSKDLYSSVIYNIIDMNMHFEIIKKHDKR